jgi:hypothetical protein
VRSKGGVNDRGVVASRKSWKERVAKALPGVELSWIGGILYAKSNGSWVAPSELGCTLKIPALPKPGTSASGLDAVQNTRAFSHSMPGRESKPYRCYACRNRFARRSERCPICDQYNTIEYIGD